MSTPTANQQPTDPCSHGSCSPSDPVERPAHYTFSSIEVIDAIEAWGLGFHLANVVKYVARADHKGRRLQDLRKARWYLDREINRSQNSDDATANS